jgi:hypothetical protein
MAIAGHLANIRRGGRKEQGLQFEFDPACPERALADYIHSALQHWKP